VQYTSVPPSASVLAGATVRDVTPPVGIYARAWGAAKHDAADGVHRPLEVHVLAMQSHDGGPLLVLISLDAGWFRERSAEWKIRKAVIDAVGTDEANVFFNLTHTHAGAMLSPCYKDKVGGSFVLTYLDTLLEAIVDAAKDAKRKRERATITFKASHCDLAGNRDLPDPDAERFICGYNPLRDADDTVLVGRVTSDDSRATIATIVNYACHPTTLAWENTLLSPDFVGAMREVVREYTGGAPCLFLQGASGDLGPSHQYVGDPAVADAGGRYLGHAAVTALAGMLPSRRLLAFERAVESGASLAVWRPRPFDPEPTVRTLQRDMQLNLRPDLPTVADYTRDLAGCTDRTLLERFERKRFLREQVGDGATSPVPLTAWRVGDIIFLGWPVEIYSAAQDLIRNEYPTHAIVITNLTNGPATGYICPDELYDGKPIYQIWQTPYAKGSFQQIISEAKAAIDALLK
jgi:hypothetical protein